VDNIFHLHNYSEEKKLAMASLQFEGYALIWWEQLLCDREEYGRHPIATCDEMKREMRLHFVPKHYRRDIFDKLQNLKQGSLSVEEYYKEMKKDMIRANVYEDEDQTIAHFMAMMHRNIQRIVEFQPYHHLRIWYIKQPKLNVNCSKMLRAASPCHLVRGISLEEANQSQNLLLNRPW